MLQDNPDSLQKFDSMEAKIKNRQKRSFLAISPIFMPAVAIFVLFFNVEGNGNEGKVYCNLVYAEATEMLVVLAFISPITASGSMRRRPLCLISSSEECSNHDDVLPLPRKILQSTRPRLKNHAYGGL